MAVKNPSAVSIEVNLRPLDVYHDLNAVADLIELCFINTMDPDGKEYLRQMRLASRDTGFLSWAPQVAEHISLPLSGYVWEENGRVIGNLSLIPLHKDGQRIYLIANVAVHPEYRRRGIARKLTQKALEHAHRRGASSAWLQVRDDNPAAQQLYLSLGFIERARRITWQYIPLTPVPMKRDDVTIGARRPEDWPLQHDWLALTYPPQVMWNLPLNFHRLQPGFFRDLTAYLYGQKIRHWSARLRGQLIGVLTWEMSRGYADNLWLAVDPEYEDQAIRSLLAQARAWIPRSRPLAVNYPAGVEGEAFVASGFNHHQTLIWMEAKLSEPYTGSSIPIVSPDAG
jgi:GNAT superfamily N-acetyltransferase